MYHKQLRKSILKTNYTKLKTKLVPNTNNTIVFLQKTITQYSKAGYHVVAGLFPA